jgi:creatinine deaminase
MNLIVIDAQTQVDLKTLVTIAHLPTRSLDRLVDQQFWKKCSDADYMRIAVLLAEKSSHEGGCPIGAVVVDNASRKIMGKGHNTLVQENHPYNHGETSAMRDAGSIDYSQTTIYTSLTPCNVCATLMVERGVARVVIGNSPDPENNETWLRERGVEVVSVRDDQGTALYRQYREQHPELDIIDWKGVAALRKKRP